MAFTREDYDALINLVMGSPELSERMRVALFGQALSALPAEIQAINATLSRIAQIQEENVAQIKALAETYKHVEEQMAGLMEAQKRTEEQMAGLMEAQKRTEEQIAGLIEAQKRTEEQVAKLIEDQHQLREEQLQMRAELRALAEAQKRTEEQIAGLIEAQKRTEEQIAGLIEAQKRAEEQIAGLIEAQKRTEEQIAKLIEDQRQLWKEQRQMRQEMKSMGQRLDALTESHYQLESRVGRLTGMVLEINYERKAQARFGRLLRKARVVEWNVLEDLLENLSPEEIESLSEIDLVVQGNWRQNPKYKLFLAIEVSGKIDVRDVHRAVERAQLMHQAGLLTLPVVAGDEISGEAKAVAQEQGVIIVLDGSMEFIDESLRKHLPSLS